MKVALIVAIVILIAAAAVTSSILTYQFFLSRTATNPGPGQGNSDGSNVDRSTGPNEYFVRVTTSQSCYLINVKNSIGQTLLADSDCGPGTWTFVASRIEVWIANKGYDEPIYLTIQKNGITCFTGAARSGVSSVSGGC